jgi:hypothetical protein
LDVRTYLENQSKQQRVGLTRLRVIGIGVAIGAVFALAMAFGVTRSGNDLVYFPISWAMIMTGPMSGTAYGAMSMAPMLMIPGWIGVLLIPAHSIKPGPLTAFLTFLGFALWYWSGFWSFVYFHFAG